MHWLALSTLSWLWPTAAVASEVKHVAIIGAGAAGSSTAYYLRRFAEAEGVSVNITIFEKTERIGGRTLTVDAFDSPMEPVELGASIFITLNEVLYNASQEFGLPLKDPSADDNGDLAVWDGDKFVYLQEAGSSGWWNLAKLFWRYGRAPYRTQKLVDATIGTFLKMYKPPYFPFRSLTTTAFQLELTKITGVTGEEFLKANYIDGLFAREIIQASTRVNYASNLAYIHGLETMVSMAPEGAVGVVGGNWQIFDKMVEKANATVYKNTAVTAIELDETEDPVSPHTKFLITTKATDDDSAAGKVYPVHFDNVVIATPWQYSGIKASGEVLQHAIDEIPYTKLHVTLFASPFQLSAQFFGMNPGSRAPTVILTTLGPDEKPEPGAAGAGKSGFYSISTLRTITNPKTMKDEYLYKIFSPEVVTPEFLSSLLGVKVPETFVRSPNADPADFDATMVDPISWYYPHWFYSYPIELPRVTFQDPILRGGLYYTSGIESFISTMETSGLMGMNVARLIADDFLLQLKRPGAEEQESGGDPLQSVLGGKQDAKAPGQNATLMEEL